MGTRFTGPGICFGLIVGRRAEDEADIWGRDLGCQEKELAMIGDLGDERRPPHVIVMAFLTLIVT